MIEQLSFFEEELDFSVKPISVQNKHLEELYNYAKSKAIELWNREFDIEIKVTNANWSRWLGYYTFNRATNKGYIKMSLRVNSRYSKEEVYGTLLHEMVHWHLHTSNKPFRDSDVEFALECLRVGAPFSSTIAARKAKELAEKVFESKI